MKKKFLMVLLTIFVFCIGIAFSACGKVDFKYTIDFVVDGEVIASVGTDSETIAMPKNPTKEGYSFDGWYWDEGKWYQEFTLASIAEQPLQEENNFKVYAKWKSTEFYFVQFSAGSGNGEMQEQKIPVGELTALTKNTFTARKGYVFDGWEYQSNRYDDGEKVLDICEAGETITLYAQWREAYYTIKYDANGGTGTMTDRRRQIGYDLCENRPYFEPPTGKEFNSWNTKADGTGLSVPAYTDIPISTKEGDIITLYAIWSFAETTFYFDSNGGSGYMPSPLVVYYGDKTPAANEYTPPKAYMVFGSWNTKADGTGIKILETDILQDFMTAESITLYAQWKIIENNNEDNNENYKVISIEKASDFDLLRGNSTNTVAFLKNDIDFNGASLLPIGTYENPFNAVFYGNGYALSNFTIGNTSTIVCDAGSSFFGVIGRNGHIQALGLENFTCIGVSVASFASSNQGKIESCYSNGSLIGQNYYGESFVLSIAGIACNNEAGSVLNCYYTGTIQGETTASAHAYGIADRGTITNCFSACSVILQSEDNVGSSSFRTIGDNGSSTIKTNCYYYKEMPVSINGTALSATDLYQQNSDFRKEASEINGVDFFTDKLNWSTEIWDLGYLTQIDVANRKLPKLKNQTV